MTLAVLSEAVLPLAVNISHETINNFSTKYYATFARQHVVHCTFQYSKCITKNIVHTTYQLSMVWYGILGFMNIIFVTPQNFRMLSREVCNSAHKSIAAKFIMGGW